LGLFALLFVVRIIISSKDAAQDVAKPNATNDAETQCNDTDSDTVSEL
jgi:hypothetical protein